MIKLIICFFTLLSSASYATCGGETLSAYDVMSDDIVEVCVDAIASDHGDITNPKGSGGAATRRPIYAYKMPKKMFGTTYYTLSTNWQTDFAICKLFGFSDSVEGNLIDYGRRESTLTYDVENEAWLITEAQLYHASITSCK